MKAKYAHASAIPEASDDLEPVDLEKTPKAGNKPRPPMTPAQQALALHYLPLARRLAKPFKATFASYWDDFESAACLGLVEAAQSYDSSKRVKFATYARVRILGELRDVKRDMQLSGWRDSENPPTVQHLGHQIEGRGRVLCAEPQPPVETELETRDTFETWLAKLPKPNAAICRLIYVEDMTHRQAGAALGRSKSRVQLLHKESLDRLNESFQWKSKTEHPDDWVKSPLPAHKKASLGRPEFSDVPPAEVSLPETVEP
jgi:RNA polymerase sigma factor (sigma-70 family)